MEHLQTSRYCQTNGDFEWGPLLTTLQGFSSSFYVCKMSSAWLKWLRSHPFGRGRGFIFTIIRWCGLNLVCSSPSVHTDLFIYSLGYPPLHRPSAPQPPEAQETGLKIRFTTLFKGPAASRCKQTVEGNRCVFSTHSSLIDQVTQKKNLKIWGTETRL